MEAYLDNSATTSCSKAATEKMVELLTQDYGNPSSLHMKGVIAEKYITEAKKKIAKTLKVDEKELVFTSGGTESNNLAIIGSALANKRTGMHVITTAIEHHAVLNCMKELETQGYEVTYLQPDKLGNITPEALKAALRKDTILVSIMMVNNEVGSVMPISAMAKLTHKICPDAIFHTDAVQGFLKIPFAAKTLGADLISISSHKVHGPKGAGALYISPRLKSFPALLLGGGQESGFRSGTEATPAILGFAAAATAGAATFREDIAREKALYAFKKTFFGQLNGREKAFVRFRHYAVMVVAYLRNKM